MSSPARSIVTIGQGRRLTLSELYAVSTQRATLQWIEPALEGAVEHNVVTDTLLLGTLSIEDIDSTNVDQNLSMMEAKALFTLVAFQVAHWQGNQSPLARWLAQLANQSSEGSTLSRIPRTAIVETVEQLVIEAHTVTATERSTLACVPRCATLSVAALAVYQATQLATCALPVAALTVDSTGHASSALTWYAEDAMEKRPHRSMLRAAAVVRAMLHESRSGGGDGASLEPASTHAATILAALRDIPQYHGPTMEQLATAASQLELELNSQAASVDAALDPTLVETILQTAATAVMIQWTKSRQRQGLDPIVVATDTALPSLVAAWKDCLSHEAATAMARIQAATPTMVTTFSPEAPAVRPATAHDKPDEFAGLSEVQVAKILRIRAEKEAKAAAKRQAKEAKGASVFGTGTHMLSDVLRPFVSADGSTVQFLPVDNHDASTESLVHQWTNAMETLLSGGVQRKPKIPKGTRDYLPEQMMIRQQAFDIIRRVFAAHGAVEIDTPVFELKETLTGKYGEDSKLIYDLADQGGELLALRYDLTVPFARFLALNNVGHIKRYHIGKVYRRDQPALKRGRYREFYQCDFDIAGSFGRMVPDSECLCVVCDILDALPIGDFAIKVNHRCLLDAILDLCGVPAEKFRTICSAVDKLDKEPWEEVKREMVEDKGLQENVADKIGEFVLNKGQPFELYKQLMDAKRFGDHKGAAQAMEDLRILFEYLEAFDKLKFISFDLSLARGLDYYTGVIYEAICISGNSQVGSIGGGGRYDNLVSMFQGAGKQTPCVGVSVGIERVFTLMEARLREEKGGSIKQPNVSVLIATAGAGMMKEKMKIARMLWDAKISAEFNQQEKSKLSKEVVDALDREIPYMVVIGESELADSKCQVKDIKAETAELVPIPDLVAYLRSKGVIPVGCEFAAELLKQEVPK